MAELPRTVGGQRLTWQPLSPALVPAWNQLCRALLAADGGTEVDTEDSLRKDLEQPGMDAPGNSIVALDDVGAARAFGFVSVRPGDKELLRAWMLGGVHPQWRGRGIGRALMAWSLERGRAIVAARRAELGPDDDGHPVPAVAFTVSERDDGSVIPLARRLGLDSERVFAVMRRSLADRHEVLPEPVVAEGLRLETWRPELDEAIRLAHNASFADHFQFQPWAVESWQSWQTGADDFRPGWSHVVLDGDQVAGYVLNSEHGAEAGGGVAEGWTDKIGVLPSWRGRGLAKALLLASLSSFRHAGLEHAGLDVDTGNATGATQLYAGLGYTVRARSVHLTMTI